MIVVMGFSPLDASLSIPQFPLLTYKQLVKDVYVSIRLCATSAKNVLD